MKITHFKNGNVRETKKRRKYGNPCGIKCSGGCVCGYHPNEKRSLLGDNPNLGQSEWDALIAWLSRRDLAWHNALFDILIFHAGPPFPGWSGIDLLPNTVWCTMLAQRVLDPDHPLGLKPVTERRFDLPPEEKDALEEHLKERKLPPKRYDLADWDVMEPYAASDTARTAMLALDQWFRFRSGEAQVSRLHHEMDVMATICRMEQRGVPYDAKLSLHWADRLDARIEQLGKQLPFEPTPAGVTQFFFSTDINAKGTPCLGLEPLKITEKSGNPSTDAEVLDRLAERDVPHAQVYREYKLSADAVSRYYRGWAKGIGADGRIRTRYRQVGTKVTRMSAERINLLAIPHDHRLLAAGSEILAEAPSPRALIHATPGYTLWEMDLAQAELRVSALYADCQTMLQMFAEGRDLHGETAVGLNLSEPGQPDWDKMRGVGKRANFALCFGIGPDKFRGDLRKQVGVDLGQTRTRQLVQDWNILYPEYKRIIQKEMDLAERRGWTPIKGPIRKYYSDREKKYHDYHKAFNAVIQGVLGEFAKEWMIRADRYLIEQGVDEMHAGLLLFIHDSIVVLVPTDSEGELLVKTCANIAEEMWTEWFPGVGGKVEIKLWAKG